MAAGTAPHLPANRLTGLVLRPVRREDDKATVAARAGGRALVVDRERRVGDRGNGSAKVVHGVAHECATPAPAETTGRSGPGGFLDDPLPTSESVTPPILPIERDQDNRRIRLIVPSAGRRLRRDPVLSGACPPSRTACCGDRPDREHGNPRGGPIPRCRVARVRVTTDQIPSWGVVAHGGGRPCPLVVPQRLRGVTRDERAPWSKGSGSEGQAREGRGTAPLSADVEQNRRATYAVGDASGEAAGEAAGAGSSLQSAT